MYRHLFKRLIDIVLSFCGLCVCCVPMIIIAIAIKVDSKGPVIFKQERLGKRRKPFKIYKFRTMVDHAYEIGGIANRSDDPRITKVGAFLRRTSLDELPQMINILKGDMAIIGPRPILPVEQEEYDDYPNVEKRYDVLPGMFCTVDVELRAQSTREQQFDMDAEYVEKLSFFRDVKCFFGVISTVVTGKNVYREEVGEKKNE